MSTPAMNEAAVSPAPNRTSSLFALASYVALAIALTWPLALHLSSHLPLGHERTDSVVLLNAWTLWWNADRINHGYREYWDAPIFYPARGTFVLGEPQPVSGAMAWPLWHLVGLPATYNLLLLGHLTLNGYVGARFLRSLRVSNGTALVGGAWMEGLPLVLASLGVFQVVPIWGILWSLTASRQLVERPRRRKSLEMGVAVAVTYGMNCHYGLFLLILLPIWLVAVFLTQATRHWRTWPAVATAGLVFAVLTFPVVQRQWSQFHGKRPPRNLSTVRAMSAKPPNYGRSPYIGRQLDRPVERLGIGPLKSLLAGGGMILLAWQRRWSDLVPLMLLIVVAGILSMAGWLGSAKQPLAILLADYVPGLSAVRNWFRYAVFVQIALLAVSTLAIDAWLSSRNSRHLSIALTWAILSIVGAGESWTGFARLTDTPATAPTWVRWLANRKEKPIIAVVPIGRGASASDHRHSAVAMYWQSLHRSRLVNGYNGFAPSSYATTQELLRHLPDDTSLARWRSTGVQYVVVVGQASPELMERWGWVRIRAASDATMELWHLD